jgi:hypothetical protein
MIIRSSTRERNLRKTFKENVESGKKWPLLSRFHYSEDEYEEFVDNHYAFAVGMGILAVPIYIFCLAGILRGTL